MSEIKQLKSVEKVNLINSFILWMNRNYSNITVSYKYDSNSAEYVIIYNGAKENLSRYATMNVIYTLFTQTGFNDYKIIPEGE